MIFHSVIPAVYVISIGRLTRSTREAAYNAAMQFIARSRQLASDLPAFVVDITISLVLTVFIQAQGLGLLGADASFRESATAPATALLMALPLIWRRRYPMVVFLLVLFGLIATFTSDVTAHAPLIWASVVALVTAAFSVGTYSRFSAISLSVVAATATLIVVAFGGGLPAPPDFAVPYVLLVLPWLVGQALRTREVRAHALQERAIRLEQEQAFATRVALAEERARIAREIHDVVAHNVSVMVVQAGAARSVLDPAQDQVRGALLAVEESGREAMAELRNLLGLFGAGAEDTDLTPQPGIEQVRPLIKRVCDAQLPVELRIEGTPRPLPPGIDLASYRIVQEALTNALKYSGLARTEVILAYRETELKVEVLDEGPGGERDEEAGDTTGAPRRGLAGMRERVTLYGGTLEAGPRLGRGYAVRAWLPIPKDEA